MRVVDAKPQGQGFQAGHVIADKYELEALVGEGGMGSVWRARHRQLESAVALKLMSPAIASQPEALNRFLREARAAARLSSMHVVKVFDFGVDGETPFIAMELLQGESLRQRLDRGPLSPASTLWVVRQAARALAKAHAEGIVHRDLKPENLFITQQEDELLKVLDFGVAKLSGTASGQPSTSTRTGALLGTPFYMSPEQARGIKAVDHRSDIWSLGVIAFECITGRLPFDSAAFGDLVLKICTLPAPVPSSVASVPDGFDAWFARATDAPLRLIGAVTDGGGEGNNASRLLADASLIVQRTAGIVAEPLLAPPGRSGVLALADGAGLLVVGLSERWRHEGLGRVRDAIVEAPPAPTVLIRRGPRPGGLAPPETITRFGWSLTA